MRDIFIDLGKNSYNIKIENNLINCVGEELRKFNNSCKIFIVTDENVDVYYSSRVVNSLSNNGYKVDKFIIKPGEESKSIDLAVLIYGKLVEFGLTRSDLIIALGGGVVGDLCGFIASTYLRGIGFVQIPTSLLAQVDSSIGGKVAINLNVGKNLVGSFYQPNSVFIDPLVLNTLPLKFFRDGMAEVIKYGCIDNKKFFSRLIKFAKENSVMENIDEIIFTCCCIKKQYVESDVKDLGERMILNFGHTLGHAIEGYYEYSKYTHGEAVAIGMYNITKISERMKLSKSGTSEKLRKILDMYGLSYELDKNIEEFIDFIKNDKKNMGNCLKVILLNEIGKGYIYNTNIDFFKDCITFTPSKLCGEVNIPPSKSISHRAIISAVLSGGKSKVENVVISDDIQSTINAMKCLGATIEYEDNTLYIEGIDVNKIIKYNEKGCLNQEKLLEGLGLDKMTFSDMIVDCNESGSTLRFIIPIYTALGVCAKFIGRGNLGKRPLDLYYEIFDRQKIYYKDNTNISKHLDLDVYGKLKSGVFNIVGNVSSQFITGLLFSLPILEGESVINITNNLESKPYIDITIDVLKNYGIVIENDNYEHFYIKGKQKYKANNFLVESDYSQSSYFIIANSLGNKISIKHLNKNSFQGDKSIIDILNKIGINSVFRGDILDIDTKDRTSIDIDASQCPDIIPILSLLLSLTKGESIIYNVERLRIKECDRLEAIKNELNKLGANIKIKNNKLIINGVSSLKGGVEVWSHRDHRIAMMLAISSCFCEEPIVLKEPNCVFKSYPNFYKDFISLGGKIDGLYLGK